MTTHTIVTAVGSDAVMDLAGKPSANLIHEIAEAFIEGAELSKLKIALRHEFGRWRFKRYAIDFTGKVHARVTYSLLTNPEVIHYRRGVIAIAPKSAAAFELQLRVTDLVAAVPAAAGKRPYCVS